MFQIWTFTNTSASNALLVNMVLDEICSTVSLNSGYLKPVVKSQVAFLEMKAATGGLKYRAPKNRTKTGQKFEVQREGEVLVCRLL